MGSCCAKPVAVMIMVGKSQAGIIGLHEIFHRLQTEGRTDDPAIAAELVALAREFGNYIAPSAEQSYKEALLREYRKFCETHH